MVKQKIKIKHLFSLMFHFQAKFKQQYIFMSDIYKIFEIRIKNGNTDGAFVIVLLRMLL